MQLRVNQAKAVNNVVNALKKHNNTLLVAPTGSGKTVMLSYVIKTLGISSAIVVAHRDELVEQNKNTFCKIVTNTPAHVFNSTTKIIASTGVTFAMVQSLTNALTNFKTPIDLLVIDEAHHIMANSYLTILGHFKRLNPNLLLLGVTATPQRSDKISLGNVLTNIGHKIPIKELIQEGYLKKVKCKVIDETSLTNIGNSFSKVSDKALTTIQPTDKTIVKHLKENIGTRKTIGFTSSIQHAKNLSKLCNDQGINTDVISNNMHKQKRQNILERYTKGDTQMLLNSNLLIEGFDHPETSCVALLRKQSHKSAMLQMIGRGLRYHPSIKDCLVLDFGESLKTHGTLELTGNLLFQDKKQKQTLEKPKKQIQNTTIEIANFELKQFDCIPSNTFKGDWIILDENKICAITGCLHYGAVVTKLGENKHLLIILNTLEKTQKTHVRKNSSIKEIEQEAINTLHEEGLEHGYGYIVNAMKKKQLTPNQKKYIPQTLQSKFNRYQGSLYMTALFNTRQIQKINKEHGIKLNMQLSLDKGNTAEYSDLNVS